MIPRARHGPAGVARFMLLRATMLAVQAAPHERLRDVTILFADLRGFTGWVESTPLQEVEASLSEYVTEMERAIRHHGGVILQFIGDEIEAVFGPPPAGAMHADMAVAAALEMRTRLHGLNTHRARQGKSPLRHGIGIHSGTVLAGVIGSASRLFYALVGDAVNVASRIQELSKTVHTDIVVSASTRRRLQRRYDLAEIGTTTLRGRAEGVGIYQLR